MEADHGFACLSTMGLIAVTGADLVRFLQGQLTCDVEKLAEGTHCLGAYCNRQGRVLATFYLFCWKGTYFLWLPKNMIAETLTALHKYAVFSKVELRDVSDQFMSVGWMGEQATADFQTSSLDREGFFSITLADTVPRVLLIMTLSAFNTFMQGKNQVDDTRWWLADINAGIPTIYPETRGLFTPHEINYPDLGGVSFNKGCYIGQEIIARMHYLGKLKQTMRRMRAATDAVVGGVIQEGDKTIGRFVNVVRDEEGMVALAVLRKNDEKRVF